MLASPGIIEGWVKGIAGMKEGGRRVLVIPPQLGYGAQGSAPDIVPYETLIFVIDMKKLGWAGGRSGCAASTPGPRPRSCGRA